MELNEYLKLQEEDIRFQFCKKMIECLSAIPKENIVNLAKHYNWRIDYVKGTDKNKVMIITKKDNCFPELWVSSTYTRYRSAYKKFLCMYFEINSLPRCYHVDHFIPRGMFVENEIEYFIRLMLLPQKNNCSFGSVAEKLQIYFELERGRADKCCKGGYHVSYINIAKLYGIKLPSKNSNHEERHQWAMGYAKFLEHHGYGDKDSHFEGCLSMVYKVYRNLNLDKILNTSSGIQDLHFHF